MNKIDFICETIKDRFKNFSFIKLPIYNFGNPNDEYFVEFLDDKFTISYFDWRTKNVLVQSTDEFEVISELTIIYANDVASNYARKAKINFIDSRIIWFAKHIELLIDFKENNAAKKLIQEYNKLLGYNIFTELP